MAASIGIELSSHQIKLGPGTSDPSMAIHSLVKTRV